MSFAVILCKTLPRAKENKEPRWVCPQKHLSEVYSGSTLVTQMCAPSTPEQGHFIHSIYSAAFHSRVFLISWFADAVLSRSVFGVSLGRGRGLSQPGLTEAVSWGGIWKKWGATLLFGSPFISQLRLRQAVLRKTEPGSEFRPLCLGLLSQKPLCVCEIRAFPSCLGQ